MSVIEQRYSNYPPDLVSRRPEISENGSKGQLIIIGGRAEKDTLYAVSEYLQPPKDLSIVTLASDVPETKYKSLENIFNGVGIQCIPIGEDESKRHDISIGSSGVFVTGGKQDNLMERLLGTPLSGELHAYYKNGGTVIGTSAGASFMGEIMPVGNSYAPGFGFVREIIDQHFSEKDRKERLVGLVEKFPDRIGIGIDENTAVVYNHTHMQVMGEGNVYIIGHKQDEVVLQQGDEFYIHEYLPLNKGIRS